METKTINVQQDFSKYPAGRLRQDGDYSAEEFRENILAPSLRDEVIDKVILELDGVAGYSSSFLEEAFGGLVRSGVSKETLSKKLILESKDSTIISEINQYINEAN
jgi:hypothetical protein